MVLLTVENVGKTYGTRRLFGEVTFGIEEGEKIGVIGVNGTGKSTFLKVMAGAEVPEEGEIQQKKGLVIEYLPQNPSFNEEETVLRQVLASDSPIFRAVREYEEAVVEATLYPNDETVQRRLLAATSAVDAAGAWQLESEAKTVLTKLGITDFGQVVGELSGGQRKRVALARALIAPSELLILDEPTNHLDNDTIAWLESYLASRKGALLMVTHDRYFLDRVATRMLEIDDGKVYSYSGNYSEFLEKKAEREELAKAKERKRQNLLRTELAWVRRGAQARSTKQKARLMRYEELRAESAPTIAEQMTIKAGSTRLGRKTIELENVEKSYEDREVVKDFSYIVRRHDRLGIIGPNGAGKSTLLNLLAGRLEPDKGTVTIGETVKLGYFTQTVEDMDDRLRAIEYIREEANYCTTADGETITAAQLMEQFLFPPHLQWTPIAKLSGGEKRRLYLLRILISAPNILFLDEPTNDLDIQTLMVLEAFLDDFPGAVVIVSHDRYFLDKMVDHVFAYEGHGVFKQYNGGYSDAYETERKAREKAMQAVTVEKKTAMPKAKALKFTWKEEREYETIEARIAEAESELKGLSQAMTVAGSDYGQIAELAARQKEVEAKLEELMERWEYLEDLAQQIAEEKERAGK